MAYCGTYFLKLPHRLEAISSFFLILSFLLLSGCGVKNSEQWLASALYVEEAAVPLPCGKVAANILTSLTKREDSSLFGGNFTRDMENRDGECGRFILQSTFSDDIDTIIALLPTSWDETRVVIYQKNRGPASRDLAFAIERWADKK